MPRAEAPRGAPLPCAVDGPAHAVPALRYALEELLRGLGLAPAWTGAADAVLTAGPDPPPARPGALRLRLGDRTWDALARPAVPADVGRLDVGGREAPLPVGPGGRPAADPAGIVEADVLGSAFWWLAGLQEIATRMRDVHGRFPYSASLQHALAEPGRPFLEAPVDDYRIWLGAALRAAGVAVPGRTWAGAEGGASWAVGLSHDLDAVQTNRVRAFTGDLFRRQPRRAFGRALGPDARRRSVGALVALARRHGTRSTLFVKTVRPGSPEDVPYRVYGRLRARLVRLAADGFEVGLHPGYASHDHAWRLAAERARLAAALGQEPRAVRSHFLRWAEPTTPRLYAGAGFAIDSTLGFAEEAGFRRGTAHPFRLWDASAGTPSTLWEMPLAVMDTTLFTHLGLDPGAAADRLKAVFAEARRVGGCAVVLWHPAMDGNPAWAAQLDVLDRAVGQAARDGAAVGPLASLLSQWQS